MTTDQLQEENIIITKQSNNISRIIRPTNPRFQDRYSRTVSIDFFRSIILVVFYHIATGQRRTVPVEQHEPILIKLRAHYIADVNAPSTSSVGPYARQAKDIIGGKARTSSSPVRFLIVVGRL